MVSLEIKVQSPKAQNVDDSWKFLAIRMNQTKTAKLGFFSTSQIENSVEEGNVVDSNEMRKQ